MSETKNIYSFKALLKDTLSVGQKKETIVFFLVIALSIVSSYFLFNSISFWSINPKNWGFENNAYFFSSITIVIALSLLYFIKLVFINKYYVSFNQTLFFCSLLVNYLNFRYLFNREGCSLPQFAYLYLSDYVLLILIVGWGYSCLIQKWKPQSIKEGNLYLEDNPLKRDINKPKQFNNLINQIRRPLFDDKLKSSFSIAIVGPWGNGKSSLIQEVQEEILDHPMFKQKQLLYFSFSPFLNHNEDQVIEEFFTQFSNELKKRSGYLSNLVLEYSQKLGNIIDEGKMSELLNSFISKNENKSAFELYKEIECHLEELDIKIIVSIDDLDRLTANEIYQVLKLIRNTSNFPNIVFLVALDKLYVMDALKSEKEYMKNAFLDKFFQLELSVSKVTRFDINAFLIKESKRMIDLIHPENQISESLSSSIISAFSVNTVVNNYRDAKRFLNQLILDLGLSYDKNKTLEIDINDLINLSILKLFYPFVFNELCYNKDFFDQALSKRNLIGFRTISGASFRENVENTIKIDFITENQSIAPSIKYYIQRILFDLFSIRIDEGTNQISETPAVNCVKNNAVFRLYLERTLSSKEFLIADFKKVYDSNGENLRIQLKEICNDDIKLINFIQKLEHLPQPLNTDESLKCFEVVSIMLHYFRKQSPTLLQILSNVLMNLSNQDLDQFKLKIEFLFKTMYIGKFNLETLIMNNQWIFEKMEYSEEKIISLIVEQFKRKELDEED